MNQILLSIILIIILISFGYFFVIWIKKGIKRLENNKYKKTKEHRGIQQIKWLTK